MPDALTAQVIGVYNQLRALRGITSSLRLDKVTTTTGYTQITGTGFPISTGWYFEYLQDAVTGEQYIQVLIAEGEWSTTAMDQLAAIVIDSRRYKAQVVLRPSGAPLIWMLRAEPTGEPVS